jgi:hypothetical protein
MPLTLPESFQTMFTFSLYKLVVPFSLNKIFGIQPEGIDGNIVKITISD